jgi:hypothetical protein
MPDQADAPCILPLTAVVKITFRLSGVILLQPLMPPSSFSEHYYDKRYHFAFSAISQINRLLEMGENLSVLKNGRINFVAVMGQAKS